MSVCSDIVQYLCILLVYLRNTCSVLVGCHVSKERELIHCLLFTVCTCTIFFYTPRTVSVLKKKRTVEWCTRYSLFLDNSVQCEID